MRETAKQMAVYRTIAGALFQNYQEYVSLTMQFLDDLPPEHTTIGAETQRAGTQAVQAMLNLLDQSLKSIGIDTNVDLETATKLLEEFDGQKD